MSLAQRPFPLLRPPPILTLPALFCRRMHRIMTEARGGSEGRKTLGWSGGAVAERMEKSTMACSEEAHEFFLFFASFFPVVSSSLSMRETSVAGGSLRKMASTKRERKRTKENSSSRLSLSLCLLRLDAPLGESVSRLDFGLASLFPTPALSLSLSLPPLKKLQLFFFPAFLSFFSREAPLRHQAKTQPPWSSEFICASSASARGANERSDQRERLKTLSLSSESKEE